MLKHVKDARGAAAVEFALLAPMFIVLVFGMIQFGYFLWTAEYANSAARETARKIVVGDCWGSGQASTYAAAHGVRVTATSVTPAPAKGATKVGDAVSIAVTANADLGINFFSFGLPKTVQRSYEARMEVDAPTVDPC